MISSGKDALNSSSEKLLSPVVDADGNLALHRLLRNVIHPSSIECALLMIDAFPAALMRPNNDGHLPIHLECEYLCRSSILAKCILLYPEGLAVADKDGYLPLHKLLGNRSSSVEDTLMLMKAYPTALQHQNKYGYLPIHIECSLRCRSAILTNCVELFLNGLSIAIDYNFLPLHQLLECPKSAIEDALMMIEAYPAALKHQDRYGRLPIHLECIYQCRSPIIARSLEFYLEALKVADYDGCLLLHRLLGKRVSSVQDALMMIEAYPAALKHQNICGQLPIHIECEHKCRSAIIAKSVTLYPESLMIADQDGNFPIHQLLLNSISSLNDALMMIVAQPAALKHQNRYGYLPIHIECMYKCRSSIIAKCMKFYSVGLATADQNDNVPLHRLLENMSSSLEDALLMIEAYPAALLRRNRHANLPIQIECRSRCRPSILTKCIELYSQSLDDRTLFMLLYKLRGDLMCFRSYAPMLSMVFAARPMSLYVYDIAVYHRHLEDTRKNPYFRRKILSLLPRHVFSQIHEEDYADLNWQPRSVMLQLLAQIYHLSRQSTKVDTTTMGANLFNF